MRQPGDRTGAPHPQSNTGERGIDTQTSHTGGGTEAETTITGTGTETGTGTGTDIGIGVGVEIGNRTAPETGEIQVARRDREVGARDVMHAAMRGGESRETNRTSPAAKAMRRSMEREDEAAAGAAIRDRGHKSHDGKAEAETGKVCITKRRGRTRGFSCPGQFLYQACVLSSPSHAFGLGHTMCI